MLTPRRYAARSAGQVIEDDRKNDMIEIVEPRGVCSM
jgi:hypothetical protein